MWKINFRETITLNKEVKLMSYYHYYGNSFDNETYSSNRFNCRHDDEFMNDDIDGFESYSQINQSSNELIVIRDSFNVTVDFVDTKFALTLQATLQAAIIAVASLVISNSNDAENVSNELLEVAKIRQSNYRKVVIVNSRSVDVQ